MLMIFLEALRSMRKHHEKMMTKYEYVKASCSHEDGLYMALSQSIIVVDSMNFVFHVSCTVSVLQLID